jgi:predicted O-methyltransferase YrrM
MAEYYKQIPSEEMTDYESFYSQMANILPDNAVIVEAGAANGRSGIMLAEMLSDLGKNFTLYLVDTMSYGGEGQRNTIIGHMVNSGMGNRIRLMEMSSLDASCHFNDHSIDFFFLDSSHEYEETKASLRLWYLKLKDERILAGHDFNAPEVKEAVLEVIPEIVTRAPIPGQSFQPEKVLNIEATTKNYGLYWLKKQFYIKLN